MEASLSASIRIAFVGFGEAASAFVEGWGAGGECLIKAYDIKTDDAAPGVRQGKLEDYVRSGVVGCGALREALAGSEVVFSTVTADQALVAARSVSGYIAPGTLYLDCNSCAPGTKREAADVIDGAGARYVDVAVMAPVRPALHRTPLLLSGDPAGAAIEVLSQLGMNAKAVAGEVGSASSIKMIRSIMVKGLEALVAECVLAGRKAGVDEIVLDSLEASYPGFNWRERAAYMLERIMVHGVRRAAEMREVVLTVEQLGLEGAMAAASVGWQERIGGLGLTVRSDDYRELADAIVRRLSRGEDRKERSHERT